MLSQNLKSPPQKIRNIFILKSKLASIITMRGIGHAQLNGQLSEQVERQPALAGPLRKGRGSLNEVACAIHVREKPAHGRVV